MIRLLSLALLSGASLHAVAGSGPSEGAPPRWSIGPAAVLTDSPYAGEGTRVVPVPLVSYEGERFFFRGITAGWRFADRDAIEFAALARLRMDGFDVKDLGRSQLAANGIDYRQLEDRDEGLDLGLGLKWSGAFGEFEAELLADATDTSGGEEAALQYGYPIRIGSGRMTPGVGVTWQSKDMANYYYGVLRREAARGVADYRPGAVTMPHLGVSFFQPLGVRRPLNGRHRQPVEHLHVRDHPHLFFSPKVPQRTPLAPREAGRALLWRWAGRFEGSAGSNSSRHGGAGDPWRRT